MIQCFKEDFFFPAHSKFESLSASIVRELRPSSARIAHQSARLIRSAVEGCSSCPKRPTLCAGLVDLLEEPGAGVGPKASGGAFGQAKGSRRLFVAHAGEEAQF